jgi:hypothetical protein
MVEKLDRVKDHYFDEYYVGYNGSKTVVCILDDNCVRFVGFDNAKRKTRREYSNDKKELCMRRAIAWLNK